MLNSASKSSASLDEKERLESEFKIKMGLSRKSRKKARDSLQSILSDQRLSIETRFPISEQGWKYELNMDFNETSEEKEGETEKNEEMMTTERKLNEVAEEAFVPTFLKHTTRVRNLITAE